MCVERDLVLPTGCILGALRGRGPGAYLLVAPERGGRAQGGEEGQDVERQQLSLVLPSLWAPQEPCTGRFEKGRFVPLSTHSREALMVVATSWHFPLWASEKVPGLGQDHGAPSRSWRGDPTSNQAIQLPRMRLNCGHMVWGPSTCLLGSGCPPVIGPCYAVWPSETRRNLG